MLMRSCDFGPLLLTEAGYHTQQHGLCFHPCLGPHPPPPPPHLQAGSGKAVLGVVHTWQGRIGCDDTKQQ